MNLILSKVRLCSMSKIKNIFRINWFWIFLIALNAVACSDVQEKEIDNNKTTTPPAPPKKEEAKKETPVKEDEYTEAPVDLGLSKEDINYLTLPEDFPMGSSSKSIHTKIPALKGIRPEGGSDELAAQGLTESKAKITILKKPADLEFNFRNDSLYSFYYTITEEDYNKAEKIYKGLQQFYNKKLGPGVQLTAEEETRHLRTSVWMDTFPYGVMTYDTNTGIISWGFQNTKP